MVSNRIRALNVRIVQSSALALDGRLGPEEVMECDDPRHVFTFAVHDDYNVGGGLNELVPDFPDCLFRIAGYGRDNLWEHASSQCRKDILPADNSLQMAF